MCLHLVLLVDLDHRATIDTGKARLAGVIARGGIAVVANQTGVVPAITEDVVPFQAERIGVVDFMTGIDVMTPETRITTISVGDKAGAAVVTMTVAGPFSNGIDLRCDAIVGKVIRIAGTAVATAAGVARMIRGAMTAGAIAASGEVLAAGAVGRDQAAVAVMAGGTGVMDLGITSIGERRRVAVTACTVGRCNLDQRVVARRGVVVSEVGGLPRIRMTGGAVAADGEVFTDAVLTRAPFAALWQFEQSVTCVVVSISASA